MSKNILQGIQEDSPLSQAFFSECNLNHLNDLLRYQVWVDSGEKYVIGKQDAQQLIMIMRSVYLQESLNQPDNIPKQVNELNESIIKQTVPKLISEVQQFIQYNTEINEDRKILQHSVNPSIKGSKSLEMHPW